MEIEHLWHSSNMAQLPSKQASPLSAPPVVSDAPEVEGILTLYTPAGTNEQAIIDVLTKRSNVQRQQIAKSFKAQFGKVSSSSRDGHICMGDNAVKWSFHSSVVISLAILLYLVDSSFIAPVTVWHWPCMVGPHFFPVLSRCSPRLSLRIQPQLSSALSPLPKPLPRSLTVHVWPSSLPQHRHMLLMLACVSLISPATGGSSSS